MQILQDKLAEMDVTELYNAKRELDHQISRCANAVRENGQAKREAEEKRLAVITEIMRRAENGGGRGG